MSENTQAINHIPLQANLSDFYKLRVEYYRVIYELDTQQKVIIIDLVGHRREIYKQ